MDDNTEINYSIILKNTGPELNGIVDFPFSSIKHTVCKTRASM
jgi:hypothetical protein